ncbi:MAG: hypothetical protein FWF80_05835, partial [Defluviitaleaceae bacterium]|nr:hypothetical protein [Defluviitaleaceae bacterium]
RRGALREEIDHITERMSTLEREAEQQRIQRLFGGAEEIDEIDDTVMPNAVEANEQFDYLAHGEDRLEKLSHELSMVESTMDSLSAQLAQIHTNRAEREMVALDREFARAKMEMEERMRERERIAEEQQNRCEEELDAAAERSTTRALVNMSVKAENIRSLSSTRSQLQAAATRLRGEADFDARFNRRSNDAIESNGVQQNVQAIENYKNAKAAADEDPTLPTPTRPTPVQDAAFFAGSSLSPDAFRGRHLARLNSGIAGLTSSINQQVAALYRDSQRLQEQQLRTSRTDSEENGENGENDSIKEKLVDFSL